MNKRNPLAIAGTIFFFMGFIQLDRALSKFGIIIAGVSVPFWVSNVAAVILLFLSVWMLSAARKP